MRGELIGVWAETWRQIWLPLIEQPLADDDEGLPEDIFCELYRVLALALSPRPSVEDLADIIDNPVQSREAFEATSANDLVGERALAGFFEAAYDALEELGGDHLTNRYFNLLSGFIDKFNLRYDLRRPCVLCPTLPGLFASLVSDLRALTSQDLHLDQLMKEYEDAVRDLRFGCTGGRIKTCIGKQFMLLEAIGALDPGETKNTLGDICDQLNSWPHATIKEALKKLPGHPTRQPREGSSARDRVARHGGHVDSARGLYALSRTPVECGRDLRRQYDKRNRRTRGSALADTRQRKLRGKQSGVSTAEQN